MSDVDTDVIRCPECGSFAWYCDDDAACLACDDCGHMWGCLGDVDTFLSANGYDPDQLAQDARRMFVDAPTETRQ